MSPLLTGFMRGWPGTGCGGQGPGGQPERGVALGIAGQDEPSASENQGLQQERDLAAGFHRPGLPAAGPNLILTHVGNTKTNQLISGTNLPNVSAHLTLASI